VPKTNNFLQSDKLRIIQYVTENKDNLKGMNLTDSELCTHVCKKLDLPVPKSDPGRAIRRLLKPVGLDDLTKASPMGRKTNLFVLEARVARIEKELGLSPMKQGT